MENLSSLNTAAQGRHVGLPLSSYGEPLVVVAQNMVALCLIWKLNKEVPLYEKLFFSIFICFYAYGLFADGILPESAWKIVATSNILLNAAARIPQIWQNYKNKSTGSNSFLTFLSNFLRTGIRTGIVISQSSDMSYITTFCVALTFNFILVLQFWLYWNNSCVGEADSTPKPSVQHVVLFKWKHGTSEGLIELAMKEVSKLKEGITFVEDLKAGPTFTDRGQGFTHCMVITLPTRDHVPLYIDHPLH